MSSIGWSHRESQTGHGSKSHTNSYVVSMSVDWLNILGKKRQQNKTNKQN